MPMYKHTSNNNDTRPTENMVGVNKGLREFTKGGLVKGGLAIQVLLLYYHGKTPLY